MNTLHIIKEEALSKTICGKSYVIFRVDESDRWCFIGSFSYLSSYMLRKYELCKECAKDPEVLMILLSNVGRVE